MYTTEMSYPNPTRNKISDGVLGIIFLIAAEIMYFAGLISAYIIGRAGELEWPPYGQPRLPIEATFVNSLVLISSGLAAWLFYRNFKRNQRFAYAQDLNLLLLAGGLGLTFLIVQGIEWVRLINYGLTSSSSLYGAFFYVIIGSHAVHVFAGLLLLVYLYIYLRKSRFGSWEKAMAKIKVCVLFWYFVVAVWPVLYYLVYLL